METLSLQDLVDSLRRLLSLSTRELAQRSGITASSNLREWVRGLPSRLSPARQEKVLSVVGLDREKGGLRPGLHRWTLNEETAGLVLPVLETLGALPSGMTLVRTESGLFSGHLLVLSREDVRILLTIPEASTTDPERLARSVAGESLPLREIVLSPPEMSRLLVPELSLDSFDSLLPPVHVSSGEWTFERLFERLWADGIDPAEAARRLGF
jgi:transcriptional regulator with XRE-family HTH domain|uniref:Uncharacterized protein n=1 Tax=Leptospirillum ferrodiazotrophum TaxID=412449 RepID=C6HWK5_9BACT|nr:MAG: hypothetical protein UBAL3_80630038 [Leptospirillum ferrodiazotrophum]